MSLLLEADNLVKIYNRHRPDEVTAVQQISLSVETGEVLALRGPSGSGKTSLLSLLGCMARPTAGRLKFRGEDVTRLPEHFLARIRQQNFGFIFQQFNLIRDLSVLDNLLLPLYPTAMGFSQMKQHAQDVLSRLEIDRRKNFKVAQLSGGEQQRVAIGRALMNKPQLMIADEPTAHLDRRLSIELLSILEQLHQDGLTIIVASHDPFVCEHPFISRTLRMRDGRIDEMHDP
jgi:putative ABC transport system ATP-binding protein